MLKKGKAHSVSMRAKPDPPYLSAFICADSGCALFCSASDRHLERFDSGLKAKSKRGQTLNAIERSAGDETNDGIGNARRKKRHPRLVEDTWILNRCIGHPGAWHWREYDHLQ